MKPTRVQSTVRRVLIGMACGTGIAVLLYYLLGGGAEGRVGDRDRLTSVVVTAALFAALGGLAGGSLRMRSLALFAGGVIGAIVFGVCGVVVTLHPKGLVYAIFGAPIGAVFEFAYGAVHKGVKPPASPASAGVWDGELDR